MSEAEIKHNEAIAERLDLTLNIMLGIVNVLEKMYEAGEHTVRYDISLKDLEENKP